MTTETFLPIRRMQGTDWDRHRQGLIMTGSSDIPVPTKNMLSRLIITYLLNEKCNIIDYTTKYDELYFHTYAYVDTGLTYYPEMVEVLDQEDELVLQLAVYIDAPRFAKVDKHEALRMIAQLMINKIPQFLFGREDFDGEKFYEDILPIVQPVADGTRTFREEEFPL